MPSTAIDLHTHVFNVGFIPVEGVLRARGVPKPIAVAVTKFLERILERTPRHVDARTAAAPERQTLSDMLERELHADRATARTAAASALEEPDLIAKVVRAVPAVDLEALRGDLLAVEGLLDIHLPSRVASADRLGAIPDTVPHAAERRLLDRLLRVAAASSAEPRRVGSFGEAAVEGASARGVIDWLMMLTVHESRIVRAFAEAWDPPVEFAARMHLMMDMALHYPGRRPVYDDIRGEQLPRMRAVVNGAVPKLIGFAAFDPFRSDGVAIVEEALSTGFTGVKFYPPNGYRPLDNTDADLDHELNDELGISVSAKDVNRRNLELFRMCVQRDAPVFTHCTPSGMEARPKISGRFSNPRHWRHVLETKDLGSLRLCLGHAGGQDGWTAPLTADGNSTWVESYAHEVVELCVAFDNVYCDFGFFDDLLVDGSAASNFSLRLAAAAAQHGDAFLRKCCYGTDWHLVSVERDAAKYPTRFRRLLEKAGLSSAQADGVMGLNAARYLGI